MICNMCYDEIIIQVGRRAEKLPTRPITVLAKMPFTDSDNSYENQNTVVGPNYMYVNSSSPARPHNQTLVTLEDRGPLAMGR